MFIIQEHGLVAKSRQILEGKSHLRRY